MPNGPGIAATKLPKDAGRQFPDLDLDRPAVVDAQQARTRRRAARQREHAIAGRGAAAAMQAAAAFGELMVERQAGHMRPADGDAHHVARRPAGRRPRRRQRMTQRAKREMLVAVQAVGEGAKRRVAPRRRRQRHAERQPVLLHPGRQCDGGEVEQIHEIRVIAKVGVQPDRVGQHFGDRVVTAGGRRDQHIDRAPYRLDQALQLLQAVVARRRRRRRAAWLRRR